MTPKKIPWLTARIESKPWVCVRLRNDYFASLQSFKLQWLQNFFETLLPEQIQGLQCLAKLYQFSFHDLKVF